MRRTARTSARIVGTAERPRLVVNRTNRYVYAQLIDDAKGHTLAAVSTKGGNAGTKAGAGKATKSVQAFSAGEALAAKAVAKGVKAAVFDRRASKFHGRVKQFAEGAKKGGLKI
jgi:large subunit ribosomal protein L18